MFAYRFPSHPLSADILRHVGYLAFQASALFAQGVNPRGTVSEIADLALTFHLGSFA